MKNLFKTTLSVILIAGLSIFATSCSDDDNPVDPGDGEHFEANGVMLISGADTLLTAPTASTDDITGEILVHEGEETDDITLSFLNNEGVWTAPDPSDTNYTLEIVIGNGDIIEAHVHDWEFHIGGLEEGETWIRVKVLHGDHADYLSPQLPVHVEHGDEEHFEPHGVMVIEGSDTLVTAPTASDDDVVGEIHIHEGEETDDLSLRFLDHDGEWMEAPEDDADLSLEIVIGNGDIIEAHIEGWHFHIEGLEEGETWIRVKVLHDDHTEYLSPQLPVHVEHVEGEHGHPVGIRIKEGATVVVETDASNNVTGHFDIDNGTVSPQYELFFLDEDGEEFQEEEEDYSLGVEIEDVNIATVLIGDAVPGNTNKWVFTLTGAQVGMTSATFNLIHDDHSDFSSPAIEVHVE